MKKIIFVFMFVVALFSFIACKHADDSMTGNIKATNENGQVVLSIDMPEYVTDIYVFRDREKIITEEDLNLIDVERPYIHYRYTGERPSELLEMDSIYYFPTGTFEVIDNFIQNDKTYTYQIVFQRERLFNNDSDGDGSIEYSGIESYKELVGRCNISIESPSDYWFEEIVVNHEITYDASTYTISWNSAPYLTPEFYSITPSNYNNRLFSGGHVFVEMSHVDSIFYSGTGAGTSVTSYNFDSGVFSYTLQDLPILEWFSYFKGNTYNVVPYLYIYKIDREEKMNIDKNIDKTYCYQRKIECSDLPNQITFPEE